MSRRGKTHVRKLTARIICAGGRCASPGYQQHPSPGPNGVYLCRENSERALNSVTLGGLRPSRGGRRTQLEENARDSLYALRIIIRRGRVFSGVFFVLLNPVDSKTTPPPLFNRSYYHYKNWNFNFHAVVLLVSG